MILDRRSGRRPYQQQALVAVRRERLFTMFWTRRGRKSTTIGDLAFDEMSKAPGRSVIAASASLLVGSELVNMTLSSAEQAAIVTAEAEALRTAMETSAATAALPLEAHNSETGAPYAGLTREDFADLYRTKKLEMRLMHDRSNYSRLLVIAPNPATARGWGGMVVRDEAGFTPAALETELRIAVDPIFRDDPSFKMIYASNLSRDDRHPFYEATLPPPGMTFAPNPNGHFYRGPDGGLIHRVSLADAYAAGHVLYGNKGEPMSYEQFCAVPSNKLQLPWNYTLIHQPGGSSAIDLQAMQSAQQRGARSCAFVFVDDEVDFQRALVELRALLGEGPVGVGVDVATTTDETSNPTSVTVTEKQGVERSARLIVVWKERNPKIARDRFCRILATIEARPRGGRARRMAIDASNERYFAEETRDELRSLVPIDLIVSGSGVHPAGYKEPTNYKTWLGDLYSAGVNENHYSLPSDAYVKNDQRLVVKSRGKYDCAPDQNGSHGDTFDSGKLAEYAVAHAAGDFAYERIEREGQHDDMGDFAGMRRGGVLF